MRSDGIAPAAASRAAWDAFTQALVERRQARVAMMTRASFRSASSFAAICEEEGGGGEEEGGGRRRKEAEEG